MFCPTNLFLITLQGISQEKNFIISIQRSARKENNNTTEIDIIANETNSKLEQ